MKAFQPPHYDSSPAKLVYDPGEQAVQAERPMHFKTYSGERGNMFQKSLAVLEAVHDIEEDKCKLSMLVWSSSKWWT
jgi:hypothetical protein